MAFDAPPDEVADRYAVSRGRVLELVTDLDDDGLATPVPATPGWTVRCVLSHLIGGPADFAAGRTEGAPGPVWTQRQVDTRRTTSLADLLAEWAEIAPQVDAGARAGRVPAPMALDLITHEDDIRGALGAPRLPDVDAAAVQFVAAAFGEYAVEVAAERGLPPLTLRASDTGWSAGEGWATGVTGEATAWEWSRALLGRRSNSQVRAYTWSADPAPYLDLLCPFGPLPDADVPDAAGSS